MEKTFNTAGWSILNGVEKKRVCNGLEARVKILKYNDHTAIRLYPLPAVMSKEAAYKWLDEIKISNPEMYAVQMPQPTAVAQVVAPTATAAPVAAWPFADKVAAVQEQVQQQVQQAEVTAALQVNPIEFINQQFAETAVAQQAEVAEVVQQQAEVQHKRTFEAAFALTPRQVKGQFISKDERKRLATLLMDMELSEESAEAAKDALATLETA